VLTKNVDRRSLVRPHCVGKIAPKARSSVAMAARRDSAVHVSLSSDSLVKQPGPR
jgi:hypothetical protein